MTEADIIKQLSKTGDTAYQLSKAEIVMDDGIFVPVSGLNSLRRRALQSLEETVISSYRHSLEGLKADIKHEGGYNGHRTIFDVGDDAIILPQVTRGFYDEWIRENFSLLVSRALEADAPIVISNPGWIKPFADAGIKVIGGPGLNITNLTAIDALKELGMSSEFISSPELLDKEKMSGVPLMISEHRFTPGTLTDRKGAKYSVEYDETARKSYIFSV